MVLSSVSQRQFSLGEKDPQVFFDWEDSEGHTSGQSSAQVEMWWCSYSVRQRNVTLLSWVTRKAYLNRVWFWDDLKLSRKMDPLGILCLYLSYLVHLRVGERRMTNRNENPVNASAPTQSDVTQSDSSRIILPLFSNTDFHFTCRLSSVLVVLQM